MIINICIAGWAYGQVIIPGSHLEDGLMITSLQEDSLRSLNYRGAIRQLEDDGVKPLDLYFESSFNSTYPRSYNDGPIWTGKGITTAINSGIQGKFGNFHFTFSPYFYVAQNLSYPLASNNVLQNKFLYQFGHNERVRIDYVQQYGNRALYHFHPGQSEMAFRSKRFEIAASTQNFTFGPARFNHIIMSNSGGGFPHIRLGTPGKTDLRFKDMDLGAVEVNLFYGILSESSYFDSQKSNDYRYWNGMSFAYEVPFVEGLVIGFNKILYKYTRNFKWYDLFSIITTRGDTTFVRDSGNQISTGNDTFDQMASVFVSWKFYQPDLRVYFEFARNDFNGSPRRFLVEFEHSRAYTLGIEKLFRLNNSGKIHWQYEHTYLPRYISSSYRKGPPFYIHGVVSHGYTHNGQLLGAGIGPGSVSDMMVVDWNKDARTIGLQFQRIRFDQDYFINRIPNVDRKYQLHDVEYSVTGKYVRFNPRLDWGIHAGLNYRFNMYFERYNDKVNFQTNAFVSYKLGD